ncbi:UTP8 [Candida margitis]|uniref:UTP8 n=1 Tax=Candida margitis TaxID=1775924 RepID=UPI0022270E18|nr:UTP8 [Candida margitis]KAI5967267.1 UTP8 [Candida margitis]
MSSPQLADQYPILSLPRVKDVPLPQKLVFPQPRSADVSSIIDIGVSNSMLASYITKPSPKLIWSYSIKPTVSVECIDVWQASPQKKLYVVGLQERKKSRILVVETGNEKTEDGNFLVSTTSEKELSLKSGSKAVAVKFLSESEIAVVYQTGSVDIVKYGEEISFGATHQGEGKAIYTTFITDLDDLLLLTISQTETSLTYNLISISASKIIPIQSHQTALIHATFAYNSGILYQYHDGVIDVIPITNFHIQKTVSVSPIIQSDELVSIASPAPDRILLGNANMIYLLNIKFEAILAEFKSVSSSSNPVPDKVYINQVAPVKGASQSTQTTRAYYVNLKNKDNNVYLNVVDVNVGLNKLNECLGKSIEKSGHDLNQVVDLYNNVEGVSSTGDELDQVYQSLKQAHDAKDLNKWESILIPYLKNHKTWDQIKKSKPKSKTYQFKEFDVENDRIVDINFINSIFDLIFTTNPLSFKADGFIPEYTLMYLLTNPIYPKAFTSNLIQLLHRTGNITLLKQAIKTCANIPLGDLLHEFITIGFHDGDMDIFTELVNRIVSDFAVTEITTSLKSAISQYSTDIIALINKIISTSSHKGWVLIEILVDINGLFNWSQDNVSRLNHIIDTNLAQLDINSYNLTLIDQVQLKKNQLKRSKGSSDDGVLTITDQTQLNKKVDSDLNEKVPLYSIERLEI